MDRKSQLMNAPSVVPRIVKAEIITIFFVNEKPRNANPSPKTNLQIDAISSDIATGTKSRIPLKYPRMTEVAQIKNSDGAIAHIE
jgi:hypothetical protein